MGVAERRERERAAVRDRIVEAARDIVSVQGLDALSMRAIAERIEYSPATIYLHFRDKDELLRTLVEEGFARLQATLQEELASIGSQAGVLEQYRATGRAYVRFALENTAYLRVMFELPSVARMARCHGPGEAERTVAEEQSFACVAGLIQQAMDQGIIRAGNACRWAVIGGGLVHGLTSLYLAGHLGMTVRTHEEFLELLDEALGSLLDGWGAGAGGMDAVA